MGEVGDPESDAVITRDIATAFVFAPQRNGIHDTPHEGLLARRLLSDAVNLSALEVVRIPLAVVFAIVESRTRIEAQVDQCGGSEFRVKVEAQFHLELPKECSLQELFRHLQLLAAAIALDIGKAIKCLPHLQIERLEDRCNRLRRGIVGLRSVVVGCLRQLPSLLEELRAILFVPGPSAVGRP